LPAIFGLRASLREEIDDVQVSNPFLLFFGKREG